MKGIKFLISFAILMSAISLHTQVQAKYMYNEIQTAINFNVEKYEPVVSFQLKNIENTNTGYEKYANSSHEINVYYEVRTESKIMNHIMEEDIIVKLDGKPIEDFTIVSILSYPDETNYIYPYRIQINNIQGNGKLSFEIVDKAIRTYNNLFSTPVEFETEINIDNIAPEIEIKEEKLENNKSNIIAISNEFIREKEGWEISSDKLSIFKNFPSNVSYIMDVIDYAGNIKKTEINVSNATYIELTYGLYNSNLGWSYADKNYNIAGRDATLASDNNNIESLIFRIDGNIDKDFLQGRAYVRTFWQNTPGVCTTTGLEYNFGYNPSQTGWKSLVDEKLVLIDGKEFVQFGGAEMNLEGRTDIYGENKIPKHIASLHPYGISALSFKLNDYSEYSVVYQIYIPKSGWQKVEYNENESSMGYPSIISALRIAIIPNSELDDICDFWNESRGSTQL